MAAGPQRDLRGHHLQYIVHHVQHVDRFGGQGARQPVVQLALQVLQARVVPIGALRTDVVAQRDHQRVVALQVALRVGQFLALAEQALGQHLLAGQQALAQPAGEGVLADLRHALEQALRFQLGLRVQRQQRVGGHQAVLQRDLAAAHALLQHAARHAHQLRGAPDAHPVRHGGSVLRQQRSR